MKIVGMQAVGIGLLAMVTVACGGGGSSGGDGTPQNATPLTGVFVDGPVQGLGYSATPSGLSGVTDANGRFNYVVGDMVTFTLYGRAIGAAVPAAPVATALSVFNATSLTDPRVVNLSQLLLTLGGIPAAGNPIQVPATPPAGFPATIDFSSSGFDTSFPGLTLVSEGAATTHLGGSFKTVSVTVVNSGTVISNPVGINCTAGTCSAVFQTGTVVTLTATGTGFTGWSGGTGSAACTGTGTCAVTLNADSTVTATFPVAPPPATLTILQDGGTGTGSVTCSAGNGAFGACASSYPNGTALIIRATANSGSTFTGWTDGTGNATTCNGATVDCSINLTANSAIRANFTLPVLNSVTAATASANGGGGTVTCSANGAAAACGSYPVGSSIVMTATANSVSNFTGWSGGTGNATACNGTTTTCAFTLTGTTTTTANFNRPILSVTVVGTGAVNSNPAGINNCTANCTASFDKGAAVTLTASGSGFSGWSGSGCSGTGTCVVTLMANTIVTATFGGVGLPPFALEAYVKASNTEGPNPNTGLSDGFGLSVALSGDTLVVGAAGESSAARGANGNQEDNNAPSSGAVYVFTRTGGVWSQQAYLKASDTREFDTFGASVALAGDTLVVGAPGEDSSATGINGNQDSISAKESGAVYVFTRTNGVWSQQAYVKASNTGAGDNFGASVALTGDTLVVGAPGEDSSATGIDGNQGDNINGVDSGAVYVFTRTGGVWSQQAYVKASNTGALDQFGANMALSGDTLAVGATGEDSAATGVNGNQGNNGASRSGAVYVFTRVGGVWSQQAYVKASNTGVEDWFGQSVALAGDTLAVGAFFEASAATGVDGNQTDNSVIGSGAVYVFTRTGGVWSQQAYVKASNTSAGDRFGVSVALVGDRLAIGADSEASAATGINGNQGDNSAAFSGAVYVFTRVGGVWSQQAYVKALNTGAGDIFGASVALFGDTLAVGAPVESSAATGVNGNQADNSASGSGAVYVYRAQ